MPLFARIQETSTNRANGGLFVRVWIWRRRADYDASKPPAHLNDHTMFLTTQGRQVVTDARGRFKRSDGVFVTEQEITDAALRGDSSWRFETEVIQVDVRLQIKDNIRKHAEYWLEAERQGNPLPVDWRSKLIRRDQSDPQNVLEVAKTLRDEGFEA